ncbi:MAG: type IV secretion system DNA-binding domain-containing protein [Planctomycetes bacterium]|nr:type IV secretion system DNA-binding domain-containing protein [Planctomycetota bacterium]
MIAARERCLMALTAAALAGLGSFLFVKASELPQGARLMGCVCGAAALWPVTCWLRSRRTRNGSPQLVTDLPVQGESVYMGIGTDWTVRHTCDLRQAAMIGLPPPAPRPVNLFLPVCELEKHVLLLGTTGSGKTRMLELLIAQAIRRGDATAVIDPKGDERLLARVWDECRRSGRKLQLIALPYPEASLPYNPVAQFAEVREVADRIAALLPAGGDAEPFRNFAWEVIHATASGMRRAGEPMTLAGLKRFALDEPWELVKRVVRAVDPGFLKGRDPRKAAEMAARSEPALQALLALVTRPADHTQKMTSALWPLLSKLAAGSNRDLLSPAQGGFAWSRLDVAYFFLGSLLGADSALAVARMALLDVQSYVGMRYAYGRGDRPVSLFVDELADVLSPAFVHVLNKSRGAGVRVTATAQTLADLEAALGSRARARQVVGNVNTVLQFRAQSAEDAEAFAALAGDRLMPATTEGETYEPSMFTSGLETVEDFRALFGRQRVWRDEPLVPPWAIQELSPFHYYAHWSARTVRGEVPLMPAPSTRYVEALKKHAAQSLGVVVGGSDDNRYGVGAMVGPAVRT